MPKMRVLGPGEIIEEISVRMWNVKAKHSVFRVKRTEIVPIVITVMLIFHWTLFICKLTMTLIVTKFEKLP